MQQFDEGPSIVVFDHPIVGSLVVQTGMDQISWGYVLNTANYPTYGGEVIQILSCYVDDLRIQGTIRDYPELERIYGYFASYIKIASSGGSRDERAMKFFYPHRGWEFDIIITQAPGYRKSRDLVAPEWQIEAFVVNDEGDVDSLSELIIQESDIKAQIGSDDPNFSENFGLKGEVRFIDHNPFSDPFGDTTRSLFQKKKSIQGVEDYYNQILPSYLAGDFDTIFGNIGSKPSSSNVLSADSGNQTPAGVQERTNKKTANKIIKSK